MNPRVISHTRIMGKSLGNYQTNRYNRYITNPPLISIPQGLQTAREEIAFIARSKIFQIFLVYAIIGVRID